DRVPRAGDRHRGKHRHREPRRRDPGEEAPGRASTCDPAVGVRPLCLPAPPGCAARESAAPSAGVVLALGGLARSAVPPARRRVRPLADRPDRACARLRSLDGLRPTGARPRLAGAALYDVFAPTASRGVRLPALTNIERVKGVAAAALAAALAVCLALPAGAAPVHLQHVTVIGDSVADAISLSSSATAILAQGISLDLEVAPCRRVEGAGCPYDGVRPPSAIDLITSLGPKLGPNVVIAVGYNDFEDQYAGEIQDALAALKAAGVKHVWWLTMRAARHPYLTMNADIGAAAQESPQLTVVDWNVYSRSHPSWFRSDGIHLENAGAVAMATLIH